MLENVKYALLDGKNTALQIKNELAKAVSERVKKSLKTPHLAAILVGDDGASETYVNAKVKACEKIGFHSSLIRLPENITEIQLLSEVEKLNKNPEIDGFIVQLPLPKHINEEKVIESVNPSKDVDGFHPINVGRMALGLPSFISATPKGIIELLKRNHIETEGKHCVIVGRSNIVGTPVSILLSRKGNPGNATVTICHSRTKGLESICKTADILVVAIGKPHFIGKEAVKEGAVVVDVGIHRIVDPSSKSGYRLIGDVDFDEVAPICKAITPVPGGVGPMTIAALLQNTMLAVTSSE